MKDGLSAEKRKKSLTEMTAVLMTGRVIAFAITFFIPIVMVRIFDQEDFGVYKQIFLISMTVVPILGFSIGQNVYYFFPRETQRRKAIVFNIFLIYTVIGTAALLLFLFFPSLISYIFRDEKISEIIPWIGVYSAILLLSSFFEEVSVANKNVVFSSFVIVISDLIRSVFIIGAAFFTKSLLMVLMAAILYGIIRLVFFFIYIEKHLDKSPERIDIKLMQKQIKYSFPYGLESSLFYIRTQLHNFFVSFFFSPKMFAIYSIGVFQIPILGLVRQSVGTIMVSEMARLQSIGDIERIKTIFTNSVKKLALCCLPMFFFLLIVREEFIVLLFTENYIDSVPIFSINLMTFISAIFIADPIFRIFPAYQYYRVILSIIILLCIPPTLYLFNRYMGMMGIVTGNMMLIMFLELILFIKCLKILSYARKDIYIMLSQNMKIFMIAGISCVPVIVLRSTVHFINIPLFLIAGGISYMTVYLLMILKFNLLTHEEKQFALNKIQNTKLAKLINRRRY